MRQLPHDPLERRLRLLACAAQLPDLAFVLPRIDELDFRVLAYADTRLRRLDAAASDALPRP